MTATSDSLTASQRRYLAEIVSAPSGERFYNGRARRPLKALEALGLIETYWHPEARGNATPAQVWHARPTEAGRALLLPAKRPAKRFYRFEARIGVWAEDEAQARKKAAGWCGTQADGTMVALDDSSRATKGEPISWRRRECSGPGEETRTNVQSY